MEDTLRTLNLMVSEGVIEKYAIAGAVGAAYYIPPTFTEDLDVFVPVHIKDGLVDLGPISEFMKKNACPMEDVGYRIGKWLVQFLPVSNVLTEEALEQSREALFGQIPTRILTAEHLAAIMLQVGRPKDMVRLASFWTSQQLNQTKFADILTRHNLLGKWQSFVKRYGASEPQ